MSDLTWLRCGTLLDGRGGEPRSDVAIGIRGATIAEVVPWSELPDEARAHARDLSDRTIAPGFIDAHVHLLFTCDVDHDATRRRFETATTAELAITGARNAQEALLGGVTTVRDCGDTRYIVRELRDAVRAGTLVGPRILTAGAPLTTTGGHLHWCGNTADSPDEIRKAVRTMCTEGVDLVKIMSSGGAMTRESNVLEPQFDAADLQLAVTEAHRFGRRVAAHSLNAESVRRGIAAGVDTLEHCYWRDPEGNYLDTSDLIALLAPTTTSVVVTMAGIARALLAGREPGPQVEQDAAVAASPTGALSSDYRWAREVADAGVNVVLASDAGVRFTPFRRFDETVQCGVEALGVTPSEAVAMATHHAAIALGIEAEVGLVEPGFIADLVVLEGRDVSTRLGAVSEVYRDGRVVARDAQLVLPALLDPARS
jgi:imidazolonepropionase-like amidohydrolase